MPEKDARKADKKLAVVTILGAVAVIAVGEIIYAHRGGMQTQVADKATNKQASQNDQATTGPKTKTPNASGFSDGTYKASGSYSSPGGQESITVSVTLKDGTVTDSSAVSGAQDLVAKQYQADFIGAYKTEVVGKKITDIKVSRVAGSSLTSQGFNDAIAKIEAAAKSS